MEDVHMSQQRVMTQPEPFNKPLWTQDEAIAYECAREVINDMVSICSNLISQEEKKNTPDLKRIQELDLRVSALFKERNAMSWHDQEIVAKIRSKYGSKIRAYREGGKCPV